MKRLILIVVLNTLPLPALAHKVIASVFPSGKAIEGEIGLSNGEMATGQTVEILGPDGTLLGETVTDEDGFFLFVPSQPVAHRFRADMGAGHVADVTMPAAEVAEILGVAAPAPAPARAVATNLTASAPGLTDSDRSEIARIVRDEMRPLRREIAAYREKNDLQTILGGLGYILGLFGIGFYITARRRWQV